MALWNIIYQYGVLFLPYIILLLLLVGGLIYFMIKKIKKSRKEMQYVEGGKIDGVPFQIQESLEKQKLNVQAWKQRYVLEKKPDSAFLMEMNLLNGDRCWFIIDAKNNKFNFKGGIYVIDSSIKRYDQTSKLYYLRYYEGFSLPVMDMPDIGEITAKTSGEFRKLNIRFATNPKSLRDFLISAAIQMALAGGQLMEWLNKTWIVLLIILVETSIIFLMQTGILKHLPGFG